MVGGSGTQGVCAVAHGSVAVSVGKGQGQLGLQPSVFRVQPAPPPSHGISTQSQPAEHSGAAVVVVVVVGPAVVVVLQSQVVVVVLVVVVDVVPQSGGPFVIPGFAQEVRVQSPSLVPQKVGYKQSQDGAAVVVVVLVVPAAVVVVGQGQTVVVVSGTAVVVVVVGAVQSFVVSDQLFAAALQVHLQLPWQGLAVVVVVVVGAVPAT